jgi:hypothetical protein
MKPRTRLWRRGPLASSKEVTIMGNNRNLVIGAAVVVLVAVAAYFMFTGDEATPPQPTPPATTQPKS